MAGDWIKIEENMTEKPEVLQMAASLVIDPDAVAGKLIRIWVWASRNCNGDGVTNVTVAPLLNRIAGVTGFTDAMLSVGWLAVDGNSLIFPNFDRHCSKTAKERANTNRRVAKLRECNAQTVTNVTPAPLQKPLPEKRREENSKEPPNPQGGIGKKSDNLPSSPNAIRIAQLFSRRLTTKWSAKEIRAFKAIGPMDPEDLELVCRYTEAERAKGEKGRHRRDLATFLNNFTGEIDRAREMMSVKTPTQEKRVFFDQP